MRVETYVYDCLIKVRVRFVYDPGIYKTPEAQAKLVAMYGVREDEEVVECRLVEVKEGWHV